MFSFIAFSETWLDEYKQGLTFKCRHDLEYFDGEMETMLIEIKGGGGGGGGNLECSLIIGALYRIPNACVAVLMKECVTFWTVYKGSRKFAIFSMTWI